MHKEQGWQREDEIDLLELVRQLWKGRVLLALITAAVTFGATAYAMMVTPEYGAQAVIAPGRLAGFGALAGSVQVHASERAAAPIGTGIRLANDSFNLLAQQLESQALRTEFDTETNGAFDSVTLKVQRPRAKMDPAALSASLVEPLDLQALAHDPERAKTFLGAYLDFASTRVSAEINSYLLGIGINAELEPTMLYRLEQPETLNLIPVSPKRHLVISLGFVLGLMGGVLALLVKGMAQRLRGGRVTSLN